MFFQIIFFTFLFSFQNMLGMDVPKDNPIAPLTDKQFESVVQYIQKDWDSFVRRKLEKGIPVNGSDNRGETFLHHAVIGGHLAVTQLLLASNANVHAVDGSMYTPLHAALTSNDHAATIVTALLEHGASVTALGGIRKCTPLYLAAEFGFVNFAKIILVKARYDIDYRLEASDGVEEAVKLMTDMRILEGKKLLKIKNKDKRTPLDCVEFNLKVLSLRKELVEREKLEKVQYAALKPLLSEELFEDNYKTLIEQDVRKILQTQQKKQ